jgi:WD40 repeat protein
VSDAFISYSHLDREFAARLQRALKDSGKAIWVDEADIPSGARWAEDLKGAIEGADTFVFIVSPDSVSSEECQKELSYATELHKRIIPLNLRSTPFADLPVSIKAIQFVPPRGLFENEPDAQSDSTFAGSLQLLISTIDTDLDATREHTEWGKKALEWDKHTRDRSFLLSGSELEAAEQWLVRGSGKGPEPTDLQKSYVLASRQGATRRQRRLLGGVSVALVVALVLGGLALIQTHSAQVQRNNAINQSHLSQSEDMAAEATDLFSTDAPLGMLVSLQAYERAPTLQAGNALVHAAEQPLDATLSEGSTVNSVAFSPKGQTLAVGDYGGGVGLWSTASGTRTATLSEGSLVNSVAFSPNGQTLAVGDYGGGVGLWSTASGTRTATLSEGSQVNSVAFSPNGQTLAVGDQSGDVGLWSTASGTRTATLSEGSPFSSVAFSPNGQTLAVGD